MRVRMRCQRNNILLFYIISVCIELSSSLEEHDDKETFRERLQNHFQQDKQSDVSQSHLPNVIYDVNYHVKGINDHKAVADMFLTDSMGLSKSDVSHLKHVITTKTPAGSTVRYQQRYKDVPVYDSEVALSVNRKSTVSFAISDFKPGISLDSITPNVSKKNVIGAIFREMDVKHRHLKLIETELVIFINGEFPTLAWLVNVVAVKDERQSLEFIYDAINGENIQIKNLLYDKRGGGNVNKIGSVRALANITDFDEETNITAQKYIRGSNEHESIISMFHKTVLAVKNTRKQDDIRLIVDGVGSIFDPNPLATANARYGDPGFLDNNDSASWKLNENTMKRTLKDITFSNNMYHLQGPYASIVDFDPPNRGCFSQSTFNFISTRDQSLFEATNIYYHIDTIMRYIKEDLGIDVGPSRYRGGVQFDAHGANGRDNSYYDGQTQQLSFGEGGVDDGEDADVIVHELAHGIHDWLTSGGLSNVEGLSEGFGDYLAVSYSRSIGHWKKSDPEWNRVFQWDGHNEYWGGRMTNVRGTYPHDLPRSSIHRSGEFWSTCSLRIWDGIGREASDKVQLVGLSYLNRNSNQLDAANAVYRAAKDMGYSYWETEHIHDTFTKCGYEIAR